MPRSLQKRPVIAAYAAFMVMLFLARTAVGESGIGATAVPQCAGAVFPKNYATDVALEFTLDWSDVANATSYDVYFGLDSEPYPVARVSESRYAVRDLLKGREHWWKVVPRNATGEATQCPVWSFRTTESGCTQWELDRGSTHEDYLSSIDCESSPRGQGYYAIKFLPGIDWGMEGDTVQFDAEWSFDGYLYLVNSSGAVVAENDDYETSNRSRIVYKVEDVDTYVLWATSYATQQQGPFTVSFAGPSRIVDFGDDGKTDIVWRNDASGLNAVWSMDGATQLKSTLIAALTNLHWELKGAGDFNGDQKPDLVWRNNKDGRNAVWYMDGFNLTGTEYLEPLALQWQLAAINDFNGDGRADLIWRNPSDGRNAIWTMTGATRTDAYYLKPISDTTWSIAGSGDFDGDGDADLAWRNTSDGRNAIWFMDGTTRVGSQYFRQVTDLSWIIAGAGDFDGDGKSDLIWRNLGNGDNAIWFMDGTTRLSSSYTKTVADQSWQLRAPR